MIEIKQLWPIGLLLAAVGCGSKTTASNIQPAPPIAPATVKPGDEASLFPAQVGSQWTYTADGVGVTQKGRQQMNTEVTIRVAKTTQTPKGLLVDMDISANGKTTNKQQYLVGKDGLYQVASGLTNAPLVPAEPILPFPYKEGQTFKWSGTGPYGKDLKAVMTSESTVKGPRLVDTETGQVSAILVRSVSVVTSGKVKGAVEMSVWLKPGTGIVRIEQQSMFPGARQEETLRLKSYTPKS